MLKRKQIPEIIKEYVKYDETSSTFLKWTKKTHKCNRINVGDESGCLNKHGYYITQFNGQNYENHRIIFFLHRGYCPDCLDHIDCNRTNNKIDNLREATFLQNGQNSKISKNNKTGVKGISTKFNQSGTEYWCLQIRENEKHIFQKNLRKDEYTLEQAKQMIELERVKLHGSFTNHG